ncbi:MAG: DUF1566 domain-containing protein [Candidatus Electrothrix scaldis]|nr:MAG: DUF1566 domain-containing protein [Candidatus Electrothrix sp. GW3-3]
MKIFRSTLSKLAATALFSFLSATTLFAANWNPLPDTGQTQCYDVSGNVITCPAEGEALYGQDANYQGAVPSYTDNENGTVTDDNTGLVWQQSDDGVTRNWEEAVQYCNNLSLAGITEWRLPSPMEFRTIIDYSKIEPAIDTAVFSCRSDIYWSTAFTTSTSVSWGSIFNNGFSRLETRSLRYYVRCVHSPAIYSVGPYINNGDSTVTDTDTGLMWQQADDNTTYTWEQALSYCENLSLGGNNDWRLPNIKELGSIADLSTNNPAIDSVFSCHPSEYWSSTTHTNFPNTTHASEWARQIDFFNGGDHHTDSKTDNYYTRCVRDGLPSQNHNEIKAENYSFGNVDPRSDRFSVWMDNVTINGETPTWQHFCGDYYISVEGDNGKGADMKGCGCVACKNPDDLHTPSCDCVRYRIDFEIDKEDVPHPAPAYFENGVIKFTDPITRNERSLKGMDNFSIYGTMFDLREDAYSFENGDWNIASDSDLEKYRKIVAANIDTAAERATSEGGGVSTRETFNSSIGFQGTNSTGLCHGFSTSAVANFTRKNTTESWGQGGVNEWEAEIKLHWEENLNRATDPFKPFAEITHNLSKNNSAKKIMYYFVSHPSFKNSLQIKNWVGKDNQDIFQRLVKRDDEVQLANFILKKGRPAVFTFSGDVNHSIVLVQLIRIKGKSIFLFWDNNVSYDASRKNGPYVEWHVFDRDGTYDLNCDNIMILDKDTRHGNILYSLAHRNQWVMYPCFNNNIESQNIYNLQSEACPIFSEENITYAAKEETLQEATTYINSYEPDHIEVMFIGGTINGIYDQATGNKISPVFTDTLQPGQAAIQSTMGGTYHLIYLPADTTYRVEATKSSDMPYAEVYATIPNTDGTADKLYYDNIGLSETDATGFYFLVGRGNSDRILHRTGADDKAPDYDITLDMAITPPTEFAGIFDANQVQLSWNNPDHPSLSLVKVVRSESGFLSSPTDGVEIYSGVGENAVDNTAQTNTLYYYAAFSMDNQGRYSESATAAVDTARFAVTGEVTNNGTGVSNAKVEIRNSEQFPVAMTYTGADGSYVFGNLENGSYSVEASATGYSIDNSPQAVTINNGNHVVDFTTTAVPSLNFVFDIDGLNLGSQAQLSWKFSNIDSNETIIVQKIAGSVVTQLAEVPISTNYILWNVDGIVDEEITLKIFLKSDSSVSDTDSLKILPRVSVEKHPWTMFLPAILAGAQQDNSEQVPTVTSTTGRIWMDRNLGASRVATSMTDEAAYGDLYQWGRLTDGHEKRTSGTTTTTSSSDVPGHGQFIICNNPETNWRIPENYNLWQGVSGVNNPCPNGFRLPTYDELEAEHLSWSSNDPEGAFASPLKLVLAGSRHYSSGNSSGTGSTGIYWSSTSINGGGAPKGLYISNNYSGGLSTYYGSAFSIRCIKD